MDNQEFYLEKKNLEDTIERFIEIIEETKLKINALPRIHSSNPFLLEKLMNNYSNRLELLERTRKKPYFARLDFKNDKEDNIEKCYIGKVGVMDDDNNIVTVDWRAPIATLYYDSNIGKAKYQAPEGEITGYLSTKRQYDIEEGILRSFQDVDTVSNDEFLKPYLGVSADNRLKNIVSTIQLEQNEIIRHELHDNIIIQGVAGSGKTTVALHRIAYLVYRNIDNIEPDQYLVIGPSKFFVNYISNVLPDLDVKNVGQLTLDEIVRQITKEDFNLISDENKLITSIKDLSLLEYEKYKVSLDIKAIIDEFIKVFETTIIPQEDFIIKGYKILSKKIIKDIYDEQDNYDILSKRIEKTIVLVQKYIENNYNKILLNVTEEHFKKIKDKDNDIIAKEQKNLEFVKKELRNYCSSSLKKYLSRSKPRILNLYIEFLKDLKDFNINYIDKITNNIKNIKKKDVEFEDLGIIMYLTYRIYGPSYFYKYRHTVIDEAQDFGDFNFYALKKILPNSTFSIFGDLAQSIYQYRGIKEWEFIINNIFNKDCKIKYLKKSYRTTTEIMEEANNITKYLGLNTAEPVIRHGINVGYHEFIDSNIDYISTFIESYINKNYSSIAIICKDELEVINIYNGIKDKYSNINIISNSNTSYNGGICIITSYLAKGLEFDGVIIANASNDKYNKEKAIDMKLLYVSMTRALHELNILYKGNLNIALKKD